MIYKVKNAFPRRRSLSPWDRMTTSTILKSSFFFYRWSNGIISVSTFIWRITLPLRVSWCSRKRRRIKMVNESSHGLWVELTSKSTRRVSHKSVISFLFFGLGVDGVRECMAHCQPEQNWLTKLHKHAHNWKWRRILGLSKDIQKQARPTKKQLRAVRHTHTTRPPPPRLHPTIHHESIIIINQHTALKTISFRGRLGPTQPETFSYTPCWWRLPDSPYVRISLLFNLLSCEWFSRLSNVHTILECAWQIEWL